MSETAIPRHLGLILDGNRRWAKKQGLSSLQGHQAGADNVTEIARAAFDSGVEYVSAYVFSTENWSRPESEVKYLMALMNRMMKRYVEALQKEGVRILVLGRRDGLRQSVLKIIRQAEDTTKDNTRGTFSFCFNYGGHEEMVDATRSLIRKGVSADEVTTELLSKEMYGGGDVPPLDMIIRTSGEQRLSGFMLYRSDYAELFFSQKHWPEFTPVDLQSALTEYSHRQRRFGT